MPIGSHFIELSAAVPTWHPVVSFLGDCSHHLPLLERWTAAPATSAPTATRLAKSDRLSSSHHHSAQLVALRLPLRHGFRSLCLLYLAVDLGTFSSQGCLVSIHQSLLLGVEHFSLLTENLLANVFVPGESLFIKRPSTVVALLESIATTTSHISLLSWHLPIRVGIGPQVVQIVALFWHANRSLSNWFSSSIEPSLTFPNSTCFSATSCSRGRQSGCLTSRLLNARQVELIKAGALRGSF